MKEILIISKLHANMSVRVYTHNLSEMNRNRFKIRNAKNKYVFVCVIATLKLRFVLFFRKHERKPIVVYIVV